MWLSVIFIIVGFTCNAQEIKLPDEIGSVQDRVVDFIRKTKKKDSDYMNQFKLYEMNIMRDSTKDSQGFCLEIRYILNSYQYNVTPSDYFLLLDDSYVLVHANNEVKPDQLRMWFDLQTIGNDLGVRLAQKLFPQVIGGITYASPKMVCCWSTGGDKIDTFYSE